MSKHNFRPVENCLVLRDLINEVAAEMLELQRQDQGLYLTPDTIATELRRRDATMTEDHAFWLAKQALEVINASW